MSRRVTTDSLPKKVPVGFNFVSSATQDAENVAIPKDRPPKSRRAGGRIHPRYIDDQALLLTRCLPPDTTGCPRFRFYGFREPESRSQVTVPKNVLIDSYYPIIECENSEDHESQKSLFGLSNIKESTNRRNSNSGNVTHLLSSITNEKSGTKKPSIDSRTFTIYSCKSDITSVHKIDNPRPEGQANLEESPEMLSGLECFSQLRKRMEKLEEKLQQTLRKSIKMNDTTRKKTRSVQKLPQVVSGAPERNGKTKMQPSPDSDNSDTENELRNIKKRLYDLEKKLKKDKKCTLRNHPQPTTASSLRLKVNADDEFGGRSKMILKESDYTEPLHSDTDSHFTKEYPLKDKNKIAEEKTKQKAIKPQNSVKQTFLSKCEILKRKSNLNKKPSNVTDRNQSVGKESLDKMVSLIVPVNLTDLRLQTSCDKNLEREKKVKPIKKRRKKNRKLCKKNSKTNIFTEENRNMKETPTKQESLNSWMTQQSQKYCEPCACAECPCRDLRVSLSIQPDSSDNSPRPAYEDGKTIDVKLQKPLSFFKWGRKDKMPILFEEIFGEQKASAGSSKTSKTSLRFVLTQRKDPLAALKKLVKKLSQTHASEARD